jgi:hypothetical protein
VGQGIAQAHPLRAQGTITPIDRGFRLTLVIRAGHVAGERVIESASCNALAGAAAVALAFLLTSPDPLSERDLRGSDPELASPAAASARRQAPRSPPLAARRSRPRPPEVQSSVQVIVQAPRVALEIGPLPRPSLGAGLALGIRSAKWQLLAVGHAWLPQTVVSDEIPGYGAEVSRLSAELWGCRAFELSRLELAPCLHVAGHRLRGRGIGRDVEPQSAAVLWPSAGAGALTRWFVRDWLALAVGTSARLELSRPRLVIDRLGTVSQLSPFSFGLTLGGEWIW